jgi:hypothetical protein
MHIEMIVKTENEADDLANDVFFLSSVEEPESEPEPEPLPLPDAPA